MNLLEFTPVTIEPKGDAEVHRYVSKIVGTEISEVTRPCYVPKLIKYYSDLQKYTGITDNEIKTFKSGISSPYATFNIYNEKYTILLIIAVLYYMRKKKTEIAKTFFKLLSLKFYSSRLHIHFSKFCNEDLWVSSLDKLSPKHLFKLFPGHDTRWGSANEEILCNDTSAAFTGNICFLRCSSAQTAGCCTYRHFHLGNG